MIFFAKTSIYESDLDKGLEMSEKMKDSVVGRRVYCRSENKNENEKQENSIAIAVK